MINTWYGTQDLLGKLCGDDWVGCQRVNGGENVLWQAKPNVVKKYEGHSADIPLNRLQLVLFDRKRKSVVISQCRVGGMCRLVSRCKLGGGSPLVYKL